MRANRLSRDAMSIFHAALEAADAAHAVRTHVNIRGGFLKAGNVKLALENFDRIFLIAAGKAAIPMAVALEKITGRRLVRNIVVTKHGHIGTPAPRLHAFEAGHPIPDSAGLRASRAINAFLRELNARDLLLVAISGGASALLSAPAPPVTLRDKQRTTNLLLRAGADIFELNTVRKHLSTLKGGQLAALAYPATVVSLLLSDVVGDPLDVIGSGPTAPDPSTFSDALTILRKFDLLNRVPASVRDRLAAGARGEIAETPKPADPLFKNVHNIVIGSNRIALEAAAHSATALGYRTLILSSTMEGETREVARVHSAMLRECVASGHPVSPPLCLLSGGETTVTVRGDGKGGRNQEFALAAALSVAGLPNVLVLSAGTDGTDGPTDAAGALAAGDTLSRARQIGLDAADHLRRSDSYPFFDRLGDLIRTGPTGTNVMDIHLLLAR